MDREKFYRRISGVVDPVCLASKRVAVVGLGSGGSRVAVELGRLGMKLLLVDRPGERIEEHNIVRHYLGFGSLGKKKLPELNGAILNLNPSTEIRCEEVDVVEDQAALMKHLGEWRPDLIAVCTDNEQSKHALNRAGLALELPQVGAGVYDGGIGGEVYRIRPGDACYGCIAEHLQLERYTPPEKIRPDYNHLEETQQSSACALNLDIEQIASLQTRLILDLLLGPDAGFIGLAHDINLLVFSNRVVPGTFSRPLFCEFFHIDKKSDCLDCNAPASDVEENASRILAGLQDCPEPSRSFP